MRLLSFLTLTTISSCFNQTTNVLASSSSSSSSSSSLSYDDSPETTTSLPLTYTALTKPLPLYPGEITNTFHHLSIPRGPIAISEFVAEIVEQDVNSNSDDGEEITYTPVPLSEAYLHHHVVFSAHQKSGGSGAMFGAGTESRGTKQSFPYPYRYTTIEGEDTLIANVHVINTRTMSEEDAHSCSECPCTAKQDYAVDVVDTNNNEDEDGKVGTTLLDSVIGKKESWDECNVVLVKEENPSCSFDTYTGGLRCCEHGEYCLDDYLVSKKDIINATDNTTQQQQQQQQQSNNKSIFKKMRKRKDNLAKKAFPSSLCRSTMFRTASEPGRQMSGSMQSTESSPDLGTIAMSPIVPLREMPPIRSVSFSLSKGGGSEMVKNNRHASDSSTDTKDSYSLQPSLDPIIALKQPPQESDFSDGSADSDIEETIFAENIQLVGLNKAGKMPDEITVNDTLKVIFVGMALSGKTSIIKRLIEGEDAKIPHKDERTIGVDIYEWDPKSAGGTADGSLVTQIPVDDELESRIKGDVDVKFSVWDFAGQHVYHVRSFVLFRMKLCMVLHD
mmetsp:Transcript_31808/g.60761  ORF Transcript_31808/g.60761 Transcript_31808/m.60761 type:complete len:559 (+) Transcript_31808:175-1851(+)